MQRKYSWLIPANAALLFAVLTFWSIQSHDTLWAILEVVLALLNASIAVTWLRAKRANRTPRARRS